MEFGRLGDLSSSGQTISEIDSSHMDHKIDRKRIFQHKNAPINCIFRKKFLLDFFSFKKIFSSKFSTSMAYNQIFMVVQRISIDNNKSCCWTWQGQTVLANFIRRSVYDTFLWRKVKTSPSLSTWYKTNFMWAEYVPALGQKQEDL